MNKHERKLAEDKVVRRKRADLGWPTKGEIPTTFKKAVLSNGYGLVKVDDRKRFHTSKRYYGHFNGYNHKHLPPIFLRERVEALEFKEDILTHGLP